MKSNASAVAALLLLAGFGGERAFAHSDPQDRPGAGYPAPGRGQAAPRLDYAQEQVSDSAADATGPRGSSQRAPGEQRYDEVGYATIGEGAGVTGVHASLAADS